MDGVPGPKELRGAAAVATSLAYVVGLAGIVVGGLAQRDGDTAGAILIWVLSFAAGAALMIAAMVVRAIGEVLARLAMVESDLRVLVRDRGVGPAGSEGREGREGREDGPWGHQPPW